jgi:hypothetical protein
MGNIKASGEPLPTSNKDLRLEDFDNEYNLPEISNQLIQKYVKGSFAFIIFYFIFLFCCF